MVRGRVSSHCFREKHARALSPVSPPSRSPVAFYPANCTIMDHKYNQTIISVIISKHYNQSCFKVKKNKISITLSTPITQSDTGVYHFALTQCSAPNSLPLQTLLNHAPLPHKLLVYSTIQRFGVYCDTEDWRNDAEIHFDHRNKLQFNRYSQ